MQQRKNLQDTSLESQDVPFYVNAKYGDFLQIPRNQGRNKSVTIWGSLQLVNVWMCQNG